MEFKKLIYRFSIQDESALSEIYDMYSGALYGMILKIIPNKEAAEDVLQESFVKIWKNAGRYNPDKGRLYTWMHRICRNTAINHLNKKSEKLKTEGFENDKEKLGQYGIRNWNPDVIDLKGKISELDQTYLQMIELIYFKGYTQKEVSEKLEIPLGTVKTRCRIALRELRKKYQETPVVKIGGLSILLTLLMASI